MPHIQLWVHYVWATKHRFPYFEKDVRGTVFDHIKQNADSKAIHLDFIGGYYEHLHALISLGASQQVDEIAQLLKGESSHWINKEGICKKRFAWQEEYFAATVSPKDLNSVRDYIKNQEIHHSKVSFEEEYEEFLARANIEVIGGRPKR